jgi:hypothetical protein
MQEEAYQAQQEQAVLQEDYAMHDAADEAVQHEQQQQQQLAAPQLAAAVMDTVVDDQQQQQQLAAPQLAAAMDEVVVEQQQQQQQQAAFQQGDNSGQDVGPAQQQQQLQQQQQQLQQQQQQQGDDDDPIVISSDSGDEFDEEAHAPIPPLQATGYAAALALPSPEPGSAESAAAYIDAAAAAAPACVQHPQPCGVASGVAASWPAVEGRLAQLEGAAVARRHRGSKVQQVRTPTAAQQQIAKECSMAVIWQLNFVWMAAWPEQCVCLTHCC